MGITIDKVRDLSGSTDNVNLHDGTHALDINADGSINVTISGQSNVYAEDSAHTTADDGNFVLAVRKDTKASTAGTDGDYAGLIQNSLGELYVVDEAQNVLLGTIDADTSLLAGAVSGTELQVDIVAALPAGTNNIGDVDIASIAAGDNNIGNVDIVTMPGMYVEDAASSGGEDLMMIGGYRQDSDTSPVSADGDFHGLIFNELGQLKVAAQLDNTSNSSFVVTSTTVTSGVGGVQLIASALTGRRELTMQNLGSQDVWIKHLTGVTAGSGGNGFLLPKDSSANYMWGASLDPYGITASSTAVVKCIESA